MPAATLQHSYNTPGVSGVPCAAVCHTEQDVVSALYVALHTVKALQRLRLTHLAALLPCQEVLVTPALMHTM